MDKKCHHSKVKNLPSCRIGRGNQDNCALYEEYQTAVCERHVDEIQETGHTIRGRKAKLFLGELLVRLLGEEEQRQQDGKSGKIIIREGQNLPSRWLMLSLPLLLMNLRLKSILPDKSKKNFLLNCYLMWRYYIVFSAG